MGKLQKEHVASSDCQVETHRLSWGFFVRIIVIEDEVPFVLIGVDANNTAAKWGDQAMYRDKQYVGQHRTLRMNPLTFEDV